MFNAEPDWTRPRDGAALAERARRRGLRDRAAAWPVVGGRAARRRGGSPPNTPMELTGPAAGHPLLQTAADPHGHGGARHHQQLRQRRDPVGHVPDVRGELQRLLRHRRPRVRPDAADGALRHRQRGGDAVAPRRPALRPGRRTRTSRTASAGSSRSIPATRRRRRRSAPRSAASSTRTPRSPRRDDGRAVIYTGDDERFQKLYKYVSARPWRKMLRKGQSPLDEGTLYVARFDADGTGVWLPLAPGDRARLRRSRRRS